MSPLGPAPMWALVRPPTEELQKYRVTRLRGREEIDIDLALRQHEGYVAALRDVGVEVTVLDPMTGYPESPFVNDTAVLLSEGVLISRHTEAGRRAEQADVLGHLPDRMRVELPDGVYLDGGDVLRVGRKMLVGMSGRTGPDVISWLGGTLLEWSYQVVGVPLGDAPHLTTAVTAARADLFVVDTTVISSAALSGAVGLRTRLLSVADEKAGANLLPIGSEGPVLVSAAAPQTIRTLESEKVPVVPVEISEFEKAGGGVSRLCLMW